MTLTAINIDIPQATRVAQKHGINLGCGKITLPCERPEAHQLIPEKLYYDPVITWHNVDRNSGPGVDRVIDLFDYPWRTDEAMDYQVTPFAGATCKVIPDNMYDFAIASHIVEHIPHHIVENGQIVPRHPDFQDGWFRWFAELYRILKPGGTAYILVPYGFSNSGMSDPTHTRYLLPATFAYFNNAHEDSDSPFTYKIGSKWEKIEFQHQVAYRPHIQAMERVRTNLQVVDWLARSMSNGSQGIVNKDQVASDENLALNPALAQSYFKQVFELAQLYINMIVEFIVPLTAKK